MRYALIMLFSIILFCSCESESNNENGQDEDQFISDTLEAPAEFSNTGFDDKLKYELLIETHICNPNYSDTTSDNTVPCSSRFFRFFEWNRKRNLDNAFMLQVHAGVNDYPYRRLLIFTREKGELILVNGINGYLIEQHTRPNNIDDLVVGIIDDLGNNNFDRYDVILRYEDGKYQFKEAIGDLRGPFQSDTLKKAASRAIKRRIKEKELIF